MDYKNSGQGEFEQMSRLPSTFPMPGFSSANPARNVIRSDSERTINNLAVRIDSRRLLLATLPRASAIAEIAGMIRRELAK